jgi:hypothetical protein
MEIRSINQFLEYWDNLRGRTRRVVTCIPPEHIEWSHRPGAFTLGDLVRHLAPSSAICTPRLSPGDPVVTPDAVGNWLMDMMLCSRTSIAFTKKPTASSAG